MNFRFALATLRGAVFLLVYDPADADAVMGASGYRDAARQLGIQLVERTPRSQEEARAVIARARRSEVDAIVFPPTGVGLNIPGAVLEATARQQMPSIFGGTFWVERGGLVSYGPAELRLTIAVLVDPRGEIQREYGVIGLPTTFLIGRDGRAVARAIGPRDWAGARSRELLLKLLQEPTPVAAPPGP